jgi:hypothetical protein
VEKLAWTLHPLTHPDPSGFALSPKGARVAAKNGRACPYHKSSGGFMPPFGKQRVAATRRLWRGFLGHRGGNIGPCHAFIGGSSHNDFAWEKATYRPVRGLPCTVWCMACPIQIDHVELREGYRA